MPMLNMNPKSIDQHERILIEMKKPKLIAV